MTDRLPLYRRLLAAVPIALAALLLPALLPAAPQEETSEEPASAWSGEDYSSVGLEDFRSDPRLLERIDLDDIDYPRLHAAIFYATNEIRSKRGLNVLAYAPELERAAAGHARRMVEKNFFSHDDPLDSRRAEPNDRGRLAGIANPFLAENIADTFAIVYAAGKPVYPRPEGGGTFSYTPSGKLIPAHTYLSFADAVLDNWMNSSGHRANILSANALELGGGAFLYRKRSFHNMPMFKAVQNFQWYEKIRRAPAKK